MGVPDDEEITPIVQIRPESVNLDDLDDEWHSWPMSRLTFQRARLLNRAEVNMEAVLFAPAPRWEAIRLALGGPLLAIETYIEARMQGIVLGPEFDRDEDNEEDEEDDEEAGDDMERDDNHDGETVSDDDPDMDEEELPFVFMAEDDEEVDYLRGDDINARLEHEIAVLRRLGDFVSRAAFHAPDDRAKTVQMKLVHLDVDLYALQRIRDFFKRTPHAILKISASPPWPNDGENGLAAFQHRDEHPNRIPWV